MASESKTDTFQNLSNIVFENKEELGDELYKQLYDGLSEIKTETEKTTKYYLVTYMELCLYDRPGPLKHWGYKKRTSLITRMLLDEDDEIYNEDDIDSINLKIGAHCRVEESSQVFFFGEMYKLLGDPDTSPPLGIEHIFLSIKRLE